jgi:two-component system, OmpR family, sensor kinase
VLGARGRTLSARLIVIVAVLLTLACAVAGVASYFILHRQLLSTLDGQVQSTAGRWVGCASRPAPSNKAACPAQTDDTFQAVASAAAPATTLKAYTGPYLTSVHLTAAEEKALAALPAQPVSPPAGMHDGGYPQPGPGHQPGGAPGDDGFQLPPATPLYTVTLPGGTYRIAKVRVGDQVFIAGLSLSTTQHNIDTVLLTEVIAFAIVLVLAVGSGIWLIRLSLRPLHRVAATATAVAELPLETGEVALPGGVPDTDPRTEVGQLGAAFNRMLGHVERALGRRAASEARLRRFAADASHELRTPLTAIRGYAELALRHPGPVPEEVTHALSRVQSESARMSVLVDDLLLLARLDAGRPLEREPVDLSRLCIDATSDAHVAVRDHRWQLDLPDDPVVVLGDEHRLHQVLANLLSNAGKHTPAGTTVTVTLTGSSPVTISVRDDGPGIPAELIPELFERFTRADTSRWRDDGSAGTSTGLGLAIVDAVVTAHGGTIAVSSRPGDTRFTITLPRQRS